MTTQTKNLTATHKCLVDTFATQFTGERYATVANAGTRTLYDGECFIAVYFPAYDLWIDCEESTVTLLDPILTFL